MSRTRIVSPRRVVRIVRVVRGVRAVRVVRSREMDWETGGAERL